MTAALMRSAVAGLAAVALAAVSLWAPEAEASYCFTEECVYVLPAGIAIGGITTVIGGAVSIWDPYPDPAWHTIGYTMSGLNVVSGSIMALVGGLDEDDDAESDFHFVAGTVQLGVGVAALIMAALAEGHYESVKHLREHRAKLFVAPLAIESSSTSTGLALGVRL